MAAIDFPSSPVVGQEVVSAGKTWQWTGEVWVSVGAPVGLPAGLIVPAAMIATPLGWLMCGGQAVSRTTYSLLFAAVGTYYGVGDGSATFNVPDLRGRVVAGLDNLGGTAANRLTNAGVGNPGIDGTILGAAGGVDRHANTAAQMPSHAHSASDSGHGHSVYDPAHFHTTASLPMSRSVSPYGAANPSAGYTERLALWVNTTGGTNVNTDWKTTGISLYNGYAAVTIANAGGSEAHPNAQPTMALSYLISTGGQ
jgi:microcystin-dependent protein